MKRRRFLCLLGVAPVAPLLAAIAPLTPPEPDALVMKGNQITLGGKNIFRVTLDEATGNPIIHVGEPAPLMLWGPDA